LRDHRAESVGSIGPRRTVPMPIGTNDIYAATVRALADDEAASALEADMRGCGYALKKRNSDRFGC
jgi:hypothetical protein